LLRNQLPKILNDLVFRIHARKLTNLLILTQDQFDTVNGYKNKSGMSPQLLIDQANALGTAWLRLDLLSEKSQPQVRTLFHHYVESRARLWSAMSVKENALLQNENSTRQRALIRNAVVAATDGEISGDARKLILRALKS